MNQKTKRLLMDMLIAVLLSMIIALLMDLLVVNANLFLGLVVIPIVWLSLRHGAPSGIVTGAVAGLIIGLIIQGFSAFLNILVGSTLSLALVGFAGIFAKFTQKTLNNHRYSSTYLNIITGSFLAVFLFYLVSFWLAPLAVNEISLLEINNIQYWLSLLVTWLITSAVLIGIARYRPEWIIPKRSQFLSRKETSSLLND